MSFRDAIERDAEDLLGLHERIAAPTSLRDELAALGNDHLAQERRLETAARSLREAWLAMANDASLRTEIGPVVAEFASLVNPDRFTTVLTDSERRDFFITARETMLGLALGRATNGGHALRHERRVLARLRTEATAFDS